MPSQEPGAVVCVGESGLNALAIVRALGRRGVPVRTVALRGSPQIASCSRYCLGHSEVDSPATLYWALRRLGEQSGARPALFVDNDAMLRALAPHARSLERHFAVVDPLGDAARLTDKAFQLERAQAAGIPAPRSWLPRDKAELAGIDGVTAKRVIAKPVAGPAPFKALVAPTASALLQQLDACGAAVPSIVVQEFIDGGDAELYSCYGYAPASGGAAVAFTSRKLRQNPPGAGVMAVGEPIDLPEAREMTLALLRLLDYRGMLSVEFKREASSGRLYFIEWNARFDACHSLGWRAGFDGAWLAYRDRVHGEPPAAAPRYDTRHVWINVECDLRGLARDRRALLDWRTWRPYFGAKEWALYAPDDPLPFLRASAGMARWMARAAGRRLPEALRRDPRALAQRA